MKVIGAGFGRTGTMSLKAALERLGADPCFHMIDIIRYPSRLPGWRAAANGETVDWEEVLAGWEASVDWPGCTFQRTVPAERLTVYEIGQGWGPLADMLGVEAPDEPFPHLNDTESFRQMFGMPAVLA